MSYQLTLTRDERKAIDWIGNRYGHGDDLFHALVVCDNTGGNWDDPIDITYTIPESVAWTIQDIGEECDYQWDCFAPELASKLDQFCQKIV